MKTFKMLMCLFLYLWIVLFLAVLSLLSTGKIYDINAFKSELWAKYYYWSKHEIIMTSKIILASTKLALE